MAYPRLFFFTRWSVGSSYASMDGWTTTVDPWRVCSGRVVLFSLKYISIKYIYLFYTIKSKTIRTFLTQIGFIVSLTMDSYVRNEGGETKEDPTKSRIREHFYRKLIFFSHRVLLYPPYIPRVSTFFFLLSSPYDPLPVFFVADPPPQQSEHPAAEAVERLQLSLFTCMPLWKLMVTSVPLKILVTPAYPFSI